MTGSNVWIADKVKDDLTRVAKENSVTQEAIATVGLRLLMSDEQRLKTVINFIKSSSLGGATDLTSKGW